ncbi:MAG: type II toxin-antitoxin system VapC family toxin [Desulfobacteraceae bacterium]|nr:type II toxin-antitoxin system VapC family toxin [Desulfobacteraceae bacterium]
MIRYILDTDILSLHLRGHEQLKKNLLAVPPEQTGITIITVEEVIRGRLAQIRRALKPDDRLKSYYWLSKTFDQLCCFNVLKFDSHAEAHFQRLRTHKIRIGTQDVKIASITLSQNAILVTRNRKDFERVPFLKIEDWSV